MKTGDIVRLRSGGPDMTVDYVRDDIARCLWFDVVSFTSVEVFEEFIKVGALELVDAQTAEIRELPVGAARDRGV